MSDRRRITVRVNGRKACARDRDAHDLADFLRHEIELTAPIRCEHGVCGACTVLVDEPFRALLLNAAVQAVGKEVRTGRGLATGVSSTSCSSVPGPARPAVRLLHVRHVDTLTEFLAAKADPTEEEVREAISETCAAAPAISRSSPAMQAARVMREVGRGKYSSFRASGRRSETRNPDRGTVRVLDSGSPLRGARNDGRLTHPSSFCARSPAGGRARWSSAPPHFRLGAAAARKGSISSRARHS